MAEFCRDCRAVDPDLCRNGKGAKELQHERALARAKARQERLMLLRMVGYNVDAPGGNY